MKLFLLLLLVNISIVSQSKKDELPDSSFIINPKHRTMSQELQKNLILRNNNKLTSGSYRPYKITTDSTNVSTYKYDKYGNCLSLTGQKLVKNILINLDRYTWTYDRFDNILTRLSESWHRPDWEFSSQDKYTYDDHGNCLVTVQEGIRNDSIVIINRITNTYDNSSNILTNIYEYWKAERHALRTTYTYDHSGNKLTYVSEEWNNNAWINSNRIAFSYDRDRKSTRLN